MSDNLPDALKDYFEKERLSAVHLAELAEMQKKSVKNRRKFTQPTNISALAVAAALLITVGITVFKGKPSSTRHRIVSEIAYNHNKHLNMELKSNRLSDVRHYLGKLDFRVVHSETFSPPQWTIIGGRYCSIGNRLAAQLRILHKDSKQFYSWYQFADRSLAEDVSTPYMAFADGVKVKLWKEKGVLHGLAGSE